MTKFNPEVGGSTAFETSISNHQTTWRNNPENDLYSSAVETSN